MQMNYHEFTDELVRGNVMAIRAPSRPFGLHSDFGAETAYGGSQSRNLPRPSVPL